MGHVCGGFFPHDTAFYERSVVKMDDQLQKQFLSGGVTNILTLILFYVLKILAKKCDKTKESDCTFCGSSCHRIYKDTLRNGKPPENASEMV